MGVSQQLYTLFKQNRKGLVQGPATVTGTKHLLDDGTFAEVTSTGIAASQSETNAGTEAAKYIAPLTLHGYVNPLLTPRATAPGLIFASGTNRMANIRLTDAAKIGTSDFTVLATAVLRTALTSGQTVLVFSDSASAITDAGANGSTCPVELIAKSANTVALRIGGPSGEESSAVSVASWLGAPAALALSRSVSDNTLKLYFAGQLVLTWSGATDCLPSGEIADDWLRLGSSDAAVASAVTRALTPVLLNRVLTDAEIASYAQTGLLPDWATHSGRVRAVEDFEAGVAGWQNANDGISSGTVTQETSDPLSGTASLRWERTTLSGEYPRLMSNWDMSGLHAGTRVAWSFNILGPAGRRLRLYSQPSGSSTIIHSNIVLTGEVQTFAGTRIVNGDTRWMFIVQPGWVDGDVVLLDNWSQQLLGTLVRPQIQPGAIVHPDDTGNGCDLIITTSDVTAVGDLPDTIVLPGPAMTANGYVHFDQVVTPSGYELVGFSVKQTGTETSDITVKETSSGGTTVATATLSATSARVQGTIAAPFAVDGVKLHLSNSSWASNTVTPFFTFRRSLSA